MVKETEALFTAASVSEPKAAVPGLTRRSPNQLQHWQPSATLVQSLLNFSVLKITGTFNVSLPLAGCKVNNVATFLFLGRDRNGVGSIHEVSIFAVTLFASRPYEKNISTRIQQ